jgi:hypothetical protein
LTLHSDQGIALNNCDQFIIYGANGWLGRSALDFISSILPTRAKGQTLLIGSKPGNLRLNNENFEIVDPKTGFAKIRNNAIFFNAAFLRREFLLEMTTKEYLHKNEEITTLPKLAISEKKLFSFINLSSGVARDLDGETTPKLIDEYSKLKKRLEVEYLESCSQSGVAFVNCRIFSLTGRHINEFKNLALSSFIIQARNRNQIEVKSPSTKRTYVDATILAGTLLSEATLGKNANFDSGGQLVTMLELAKKVLSVLGKDQTAIITGNDQSPDYFGNFEKFNSMALKIDENFLGIEDQILKTLSAFN